MSDVRDTTKKLLTKQPDLESALQRTLEIDEEHDTWTFQDVPLDTGTFGKLVSQGVVKKIDGEYRIRDQDAVRAALTGEEAATSNGSGQPSFTVPSISRVLADANWVLVGSIFLLLVFVVLMRTVFSWTAVFREDHIVLLGNDPYFYRYWLEQLVHADPPLQSMPAPLLDHQILMIAVIWGFATLLGGGEHAVALALTWYPVIAALFVGGLIYGIAVIAFNDRRVGLASIGVYAVTPVLSYRSALGFGDHHAFDYVLVALAVFGLVLLIDADDDWRVITLRRMVGLIALASAVAGHVHAWRGGPLLLIPLAVYIVVRAVSDVRADRSSVHENMWTLTALSVAAVLALAVHAVLGWSGFYRAVAPALLLGGSILVVGIGVAAYHFDTRGRTVLGAEFAGGVVTALVIWFSMPNVRDAVLRGFGYFARTGQSRITETYSLFRPETGLITTPLFYFGGIIVLGIGGLVWATWRVVEEYRPVWLTLVVYAWVFFAASVIQARFGGQLGILLAVFGGLALIHLVAITATTTPPQPLTDSNSVTEEGKQRFRDRDAERMSFSIPDRQTLFVVSALFLLVGGFSFLLTALGTQGLTIEDSTYNAATATNEHAAAVNATWPENYVFSPWGKNSVYNYFVNGHSQSYWYAQQHYGDFLTSTNPEEWYDRLSEKPVGYVVTSPVDANFGPMSMQSRLWTNWGSANGSVSGVGHYRAVYANDARKVYELVPGAMLVGQASSGDDATVRTQFQAGGDTHTYERRVTTTDNGWYAVRVPYNGTYQTASGSQHVSEPAVRNGTFAGPTGASAHWPLNATRGNVAFDVTGGHHGWIRGANWTESGLSFDGNDAVVVPSGESLSIEGDFTLSVTFRTRDGVDYVNDVQFPRLAGTAPPSRFANTSGFQLAMRGGHILGALGDGSNAVVIQGQRVDDGNWHTARLVREGNTVTLYLDGQLIGQEQYAGTVTQRDAFAIGSIPRGPRGFKGSIRNVSFSNVE